MMSKAILGLPWQLSGKESACQCRRHGFSLCVQRLCTSYRMITQRRKQQPTPVFLPGESHGQRSLVGYTPQRCKDSDTTQPLNNDNKKAICIFIYQTQPNRKKKKVSEQVFFNLHFLQGHLLSPHFHCSQLSLLCVVLMLLVSVQVWLTVGLEAVVLFQRPAWLPAAQVRLVHMEGQSVLRIQQNPQLLHDRYRVCPSFPLPQYPSPIQIEEWINRFYLLIGHIANNCAILQPPHT